MGRYFWIIFILLGIWQVIGSMVERATKKQHDQRVKDLAAQRRRQQMVAQRTAGGRTARPAPPTGPAVLDRASELAARRKAQLDELRARRAGRAGKPAPQARPSTTVLRPTHPHAPSRPSVPAPARVQRPAPAPKPPRRKPAAAQAPPQRLAMTPAVRRLLPLERTALTRRRVEEVETRAPRMLKLPGVGEVPVDRDLLRRMILFREILDPPVALREQQVWER